MAERMTQNRSSAVMSQRAEPHDSLDYFPTPPWATRALCEWLGRDVLADLTALEPACGEGHMVRALEEYFRLVTASDVHDYGFGQQADFLLPFMPHPAWRGEIVDWVITNPPFRLAGEFIAQAIGLSRVGVAMLVRTQFLEGQLRYAVLFREAAPSEILQFCERVPMVKGRLDRAASTATSYCWLIWRRDAAPGQTAFHWLPPCRAKLDRDADWPQLPTEEGVL